MTTEPVPNDWTYPARDRAARLAEAGPVLVFAPLALALFWVQMTQLIGLPFATMAPVAVALLPIGLVLAAWWTVANHRRTGDATPGADQSWLPLAGISLIVTVIAFSLSRWGADDAHYVPNAIYFLAHPDTAMGFEAYYIHKDDGPPFRALSWINSYASEYLIAAIAHVTGASFLTLYWSGKTLLFAPLIPLVWYALIRRFGFDHGPAVLASGLAMLVIMILGDSFNAYGNWSFTLFSHSKIVLIALGLPVLWFHTIGFLARPNLWNGSVIGLTATAMIGLTTMAGFIVPASISTLVLAFALAQNPRWLIDPIRIGGLAAAYAYLIVVTLYIRVNVHPLILQNDGIMNSHYPDTYLEQLAFVTNLSFPLSLLIILAATVVTLWTFSGPKRRFVLIWCAVFTGLFLTPLTAGFLMENLTTTNTYWRLFLVYPIPIVIGVALAALATWWLRQGGGVQLTAAGVAALLFGAPHALLVAQIALGWDRTAPSIVRSVHAVAWGGPRIQPERLAEVQRILELVPAGPMLAAHPANSDVPIYSGRHPQIYARALETEFWFESRGEKERGLRRRDAITFANGHSRDPDGFLAVLAEEPNLKSVILAKDVAAGGEVAARLAALGFRSAGETALYQVFVRPE